MANWPDNPEWINPNTINRGSQYVTDDGVEAYDMNTIVKDLINLKNAAPSGTFSITENGEFDIRQYQKVNVEVAAAVLPGLYAITVSIEADSLIMPANASNGAFASKYKIYIDDEFVQEVNASTSTVTFDLSSLGLSYGTYSIFAIVTGNYFEDSAASNEVTYEILRPRWATPSIQLINSIVSTPIVDDVTKYKVYDNSNYIGYVDANNVFHRKSTFRVLKETAVTGEYEVLGTYEFEEGMNFYDFITSAYNINHIFSSIWLGDRIGVTYGSNYILTGVELIHTLSAIDYYVEPKP